MCTTNTSNDLGQIDANNSCTCATHGDGGQDHAAPSKDAQIGHYLVNGMTCSHCVTSVTEELSALPGVESVEVKLNAGGTSRVVVATSTALDIDTVRTAVNEAGYELAGTAK